MNQIPWPESASELYRPSDRHLSAKLVPTFVDKGCHVVSVTDPYGNILGFLDQVKAVVNYQIRDKPKFLTQRFEFGIHRLRSSKNNLTRDCANLKLNKNSLGFLWRTGLKYNSQNLNISMLKMERIFKDNNIPVCLRPYLGGGGESKIKSQLLSSASDRV
jgi:hypothetical protein